MSGNTEKNSLFGVFSITDRASCERAIRNGGITAMISAGITAVFAGIGFFTSSSNKDLAYLLDPWLTVDAVLIVILGIFIFRRSRVAATIMVLYFAVSKAIIWYDMGNMKGLFVGFIFFMFYFTAMRGTYIWHKSYKNEGSHSVPQYNFIRRIKYLGFWSRVVATIVDNILIAGISIPLGMLCGLLLANEIHKDPLPSVLAGGLFLSQFVMTILSIIFIIFFWTLRNATPGKMVFSAQIRDARTLGPPSLGQYILRFLGYIPSSLPLGLGFIWVALDSRKRGWHDLLAGTVVVQNLTTSRSGENGIQSARACITSIPDEEGIASELSKKYETRLGNAHECEPALRLIPHGADEIAMVQTVFPDRILEDNKGLVVTVTYVGLDYSVWPSMVPFMEIRTLDISDDWGKRFLTIHLHDGTFYQIPLWYFSDKGTELLELIEKYLDRHNFSRAYQRHKARTAAAPIPSATTSSPRPTAQSSSSTGAKVVVLTAPNQSTSTGGDPAGTEVLGPAKTMAPQSQLINGRYEPCLADPEWAPGDLYVCHDRSVGVTVRLVRIGRRIDLSPTMLGQLTKAPRVSGLLWPQRLITISANQPQGRLSAGDCLLVFADTPSSQPLPASRLWTNKQHVTLTAVLPALRQLAGVLDAAHRAGVNLRGLRYGQIFTNQEQGLHVFAIAPFVVADALESDLLLASNYPHSVNPATLMAAACCVLLAPASERHLHQAHAGEYHTITNLSYAINQVLRCQFDGKNPSPQSTADELLDAIQSNQGIRLEDYLTPRQIERLREIEGLDETAIFSLLRLAVARQRPGTVLLNDQEPRQLDEQTVETALAALRGKKTVEVRQQYAGLIRIAATAVAVILSLLVIGTWWWGGTASPGPWQAVEGHPPARVRTAVTTKSLFGQAFPSSTFTVIPHDRSDLTFYFEFQDLPVGSVAIEVTADDGARLGHYQLPGQHSRGWVFAGFSTEGRPDLRHVTMKGLLNGQVLHQVQVPVGKRWFGSFGQVILTLLILWGTWMALTMFLARRSRTS